MRKSLWIDIWNDRRKEKVIQRQQQGYSFLQSYTMTNFKNTLMELAKGLGMYKGSPTSCYVVIIPPNRKEVIRIRLSGHPSTKDEWVAGEITGLPNRRYSIVIFSNKSMPLQSKQNVKETDWTNYDVEGIPVYEKCFNRIYLKDTIQTLLSILISIYEGKSPSTGSTQITKENKQYKLNESQLRQMIQEVLNELDPRTMASYAQKRQAQANGEMAPSQSQERRGMNQQQIQQQAQQGRQGAVDAWNRDFGWENPMEYGDYDNPNDEGYGKEYYKMGLSNDGTQYSTQWKKDLSNGWGAASKSSYFPKQDGGTQYYRAKNGYEGWSPVSPNELNGGNKVAYQMQTGTGTYNKKTGKWVDESKLRKIIKESIKKVLNEGLDRSTIKRL